MLSAIITKRVN